MHSLIVFFMSAAFSLPGAADVGWIAYKPIALYRYHYHYGMKKKKVHYALVGDTHYGRAALILEYDPHKKDWNDLDSRLWVNETRCQSIAQLKSHVKEVWYIIYIRRWSQPQMLAHLPRSMKFFHRALIKKFKITHAVFIPHNNNTVYGKKYRHLRLMPGMRPRRARPLKEKEGIAPPLK